MKRAMLDVEPTLGGYELDETARVGSFVGKDSNCANREVVLDTRREPEARELL